MSVKGATMSFIIILVIVAALIGLVIYVTVTYGNKPITEIPAWAFFVLIGRR